MPGIKTKALMAGTAIIAGYTFISTTGPIEAQAAACPALPDVAWWKTSHDQIVRYVDFRYHGEWDTYITKWINYRTQMSDILERNGTAIVKSRGIRLKGDELKKHIRDVDERIRVTECLKHRHGGRMALNTPADDVAPQGVAGSLTGLFNAAKRQARALGNFGTDAGAGETMKASYSSAEQGRVNDPTPSKQDTVSAVTGKALDVEIIATCDGATPVFQITNVGDKWPRLAAINIYRTNGKAMVSKRRMRLDNSQQATFRMRKRGQALAGEIGLWIDPSWTRRGFKYDSKIICSS